MNTKDGYAKKSLTSARLLTADGGDTDNYLPLTGGTMTGALVTTALSVSGAATFSLAINGSILGNAATASRLLNARTISLTGAVTGSGNFDGSGNLSITTTAGILTLPANKYADSTSDSNRAALFMQNSNIWGVNSIYMADASDNASEGIHFYRDATHVDSIHAAGGVLYFTPNRAYGSAGTSYGIHLSADFWSNASSGVDANNVTYNAHTYYTSNGPTNLGEESTDGALYTQAYSTSWVAQIALDYRDGRLYVRSKNNGKWKKWYAVALGGDEFNLRNNVNFDPSTLTFRFSASGNINSRKLYRNCLLRFKLTALTTIHAELTNTPGTTDPVVRWEFSGSNAYAQKVHTTVTGGSTTYAAGDYFSIELIGTTAYFYKNDSLVTSTTITPDHVKAYFWGGSADLTIEQVTYLPLPNTQTAGSGGGGGGGASYLTLLSDVNISGATNGLYLKYNGSSWVNSSISLGLGDLSNVSISSPTNGLVLKYNGTSWVNGTDNTGSGGGSSVTLPSSDITLSTTAQTYITADGVTRKIKLPSSNPWGSNVSIATSWVDSSAVKGVVSPTLTDGNKPQIYIPKEEYAAFPVMLDSSGNLWIALPKDITTLCKLEGWGLT